MECYLNNLRRRSQTREAVQAVVKNSGYLMMETSYFEPYDTFSKCSGRTAKEKTVKVINNLGEIEILRPDITFNIIKELSNFYEAPKQLKLCYDSTVFENDLIEGIKEKRQIGAEYLGNLSIEADMEIIRLSCQVLKMTQNSVLVIGHTKYLEGLLKEIQVKETSKLEIKEAIYKKQPLLLDNILSTLEIRTEIKEKLLMLLEVKNFDLKAFGQGFMNGDMKIALSEIGFLIDNLNQAVEFDLSLLSQFDYYDGIIFKGYNKGLNVPIIRGGRYNQLSSLFNKSIPAVGFSVEFEGLMRSVKND
ncbi:MAG: ATP phosphoribosyltransferase regulatory subunit [Clostridiales bacterium]|nr:ATP phosphoribosyltransferase regulatory subunit [Clostridiales bacterium]